MASKKKKDETTSEEETSEEETSTEEETDDSDEGTSSEEEDSDEESSSEEEDTESSEDEKPAPKAAAAPAKKEAPKAAAAPERKEKKTVSTTHIGEDGVKVAVKKKNIIFEAWAPRGPFKPESQVEIKVKITNESAKQVKSIQAWIRVFKGAKKGKGKKAKRPKPKKLNDSDQEYFQGARFPLQGHVSYEGVINYPLPKKLEATSNTLEYEIVLNWDVSGAIGWSHVQAFLPLPIKD